MKRILSVLSVVAAAVMMAVCVSCKKDEPSKGLDFTNLTFDLVESLYGQDSSTVVSAIAEQGFVEKYPGIPYYINKSYGLEYAFKFENNKAIHVSGIKNYPTENNWERLLEANRKIKGKHLPYFVGNFQNSDKENVCTDNMDYFFENTKNKAYNNLKCASNNVTYATEWASEIPGIRPTMYSIFYEKSNIDNPESAYNYAKHGCGYDPWK